MAKYIQIQVDHPCSENWNQMTPNTQGSFCNSCKKTVIDFTAMTDNQLMEYFKNNPSGTCGRFNTDQLTNLIAMPVKRIPWAKYFFQISLPALLLGFRANAQRAIKKYQQPITIVSKFSSQPMAFQSTLLLTGKITNTDGKPVPYASVMIKGSTKGIAADSNGVFKLRLSGNESVLEITAAGYKNKSVTITAGYEDIELDIAMSDAILLAPVIMVSRASYTMGAYTSGIYVYRSGSMEGKNNPVIANTASLTLFPNPVNKNGTLTIKWKSKVSNDQLVTIYNASGQKMDQQMIYINQPVFQSRLMLHISTAGNYIMQVVDSKTHKRCAISFIVQ
ncbi:MAG: carboxypeptidase-like regulatory domain-containing protein [Ferruginibacter sp.]